MMTLHACFPDKFEVSVVYVDPSMGKSAKNIHCDYSAICFAGWARNTLWIDMDMERRPPTQICRDVITMYKKYVPNCIGCESNGFQSMLAENLAKMLRESGLGNVNIFEHNNTINKVLRISETLDPYLERGEIKILDNDGGRLLLEQLRDFPNGIHDDGPDSVQGAITLIMKYLAKEEQ
ncbi:MAG: phage terminase large subunit [Anaerolineae bacterium]|jgi:predicted phage terminase large subunit-like protein|nr:phage terminase large subunit [Anaerolineae bacterium]